MTTIILTNRNRGLQIVKKCLLSLKQQTVQTFKVLLVDYGSHKTYQEQLHLVAENYEFVTLIQCDTQQQLWCKSRAINIALKQCKTTFVFVGDIDMLYHPKFIEKLNKLKNKNTAIYFQVGFLNKEESKQIKNFKDYKISFKSKKEATGMTLFNTQTLMAINGYDEFYNGWGSEDTDVHVRLKNVGFKVNFFDKEVLLLHQWHSKQYRTKNSLEPFHSSLEQTNSEYLKLTALSKQIKANLGFQWGNYNKLDYEQLSKTDLTFKITNSEAQVKAFINRILLTEKNKIIHVTVSTHNEYKSLKQSIKKMLGKKTISFLSMKPVNDMLLESIISNLRNSAYKFQYDVKAKKILLTIKL